MKKIKITKKDLKFYTFDQVFQDRNTKEFRGAYEREGTRLALVKKIRETREKKHLTQQAVAKKASMPQSVIARLESGDHGVSLDTLSRVAHALGKRVEIV